MEIGFLIVRTVRLFKVFALIHSEGFKDGGNWTSCVSRNNPSGPSGIDTRNEVREEREIFFFYQLLLGFDQFSLFNTASDHSDHNAESSVRGTSNTDSETFLDLTDMLGNLFPLVKDDRGYVEEYRQVREGRRIIKSRDLWKKYIYIY